MNYPFLVIIVPAAAFCFIYMKVTNRRSTLNTEALFEREREANTIRKQPLDDVEFVEIDLSRIPFIETENPIIKEAQKTIEVLCTQKIANLSDYSNTDLKFKYGVANLPLLTEYDQNYTVLCRTLFDLGRELNSIERYSEARTVLEYGIDCGTDLKSHYMLLANMYEDNGESDKISWLISKAEGMKSMLKNSLINELNSKLENMNSIKKELEDIGL